MEEFNEGVREVTAADSIAVVEISNGSTRTFSDLANVTVLGNGALVIEYEQDGKGEQITYAEHAWRTIVLKEKE
jgi:hypothetical protein